jgi:hypothetical protein
MRQSVAEHPSTPALPRRMPASLALLGVISLPAIAVAALLPLPESEIRSVLFVFTIPCLVAVCVVPLVSGLRHRCGIGPLLLLVLLAHMIGFGLRALYFLARPSLRTFPNFDPRTDLLNLHHGLLWSSVAIYMLTVGYFAGPIFFRRGSHLGPKRLERWVTSQLAPFGRTSLMNFLSMLYALGLLGRLFTIRTGGALYLYNSPSFDLTATRSTGASVGLFALMSEFCPIAVGILIGAILSKRSPPWAAWFVPPLILVELGYYAFGLYKFGLIGIAIIVWAVVRLHRPRLASRVIVPVGAVFILLLFPIINVARGDLLGYNQRGGGITSAWLDLFTSSSTETARSLSFGNGNALLDPVFERLNGIEAVAVADKYLPDVGYEMGGTYTNLAAFTLPKLLRPPSLHPRYIPWETEYVGYPATGLTVVPMPTIVEAYLNFGWVGVFGIPFALGRLVRRVDGMQSAARAYPVLGGVFAYLVWRLSNVEQNLFIYVVPAMKVTVTVLALAWFFAILLRRRTPPAQQTDHSGAKTLVHG